MSGVVDALREYVEELSDELRRQGDYQISAVNLHDELLNILDDWYGEEE